MRRFCLSSLSAVLCLVPAFHGCIDPIPAEGGDVVGGDAVPAPTLAEIAGLLAELPLESMESMGELATKVPAELYRKILYACYDKASEHLSAWGGDDMKTEIVLYNDQGERLI